MNTLQISVISYEYYEKTGRREAIVWREYSEDPKEQEMCEHGYIPIQTGDAAKYNGKPIEFLKKIHGLDLLLDDYYEFDGEGNIILKDSCGAIHLNGGSLFKESYVK